jgi:hypothetical protein
MFLIAISAIVDALFIGIYIHTLQPIFKVPDCDMKRQYMQLKREELVFVIIECTLLTICFCSQNIKGSINNYLFFGSMAVFIIVMLVFRAYMAKLWVCPRCGRKLPGVGTFWVNIKPVHACVCGYEFYPVKKKYPPKKHR